MIDSMDLRIEQRDLTLGPQQRVPCCDLAPFAHEAGCPVHRARQVRATFEYVTPTGASPE